MKCCIALLLIILKCAELYKHLSYKLIIKQLFKKENSNETENSEKFISAEFNVSDIPYDVFKRLEFQRLYTSITIQLLQNDVFSF